MQQLLIVLFAVLCFVPASAWAGETGKKKHLEWNTRDLYYHDANGTIVQMELAPKLSIRFTRKLTDEERVAFFAEYSPIAQKEQPGDTSRILLEFNESVTPSYLLESANAMIATGNAEAAPVFYVENVEAVLDGFVVEPKVVLGANRLQERIRKYGEFTPRQITSENGAWVFYVDEVAPPLNILVLTNLVSNDIWVKRAFPRFKFLHDPIVASITVEPVSGTVDELRTVTLMIRIFNPVIALSTERLPEFGKGLFTPIQGSAANPSSIKHVPGYLFELVGETVRHPMRREKRSRTYVTSWKFKQYALGEWTINPQPIPYAKKDSTEETRSSGFTLVVNSQIGNLKITDMPAPDALVYVQEKPVAAPDIILPAVPSYWFDIWIPKAELVARYVGFGGQLISVLVAGGIGIFLFRWSVKNRKSATARRQKAENINELLKNAAAAGTYAEYSSVFSLMLITLFPHLTSRPTWEEIKDDVAVLGAFGDESAKLLEQVFNELNQRHRRGFVPTANDCAELHKNVSALCEIAERLILTRKEVA